MKLLLCGFRTVSHHVALVSDNVCKCCTHTYSVAPVGLVLLRGIHCSVSSHARHAETKGLFRWLPRNCTLSPTVYNVQAVMIVWRIRQKIISRSVLYCVPQLWDSEGHSSRLLSLVVALCARLLIGH